MPFVNNSATCMYITKLVFILIKITNVKTSIVCIIIPLIMFTLLADISSLKLKLLSLLISYLCASPNRFYKPLTSHYWMIKSILFFLEPHKLVFTKHLLCVCTYVYHMLLRSYKKTCIAFRDFLTT